MIKKLLVLLISLSLLFTVGCKKDANEVNNNENVSSEVSNEPVNLVVNPLTGSSDCKETAANKRPVAVMINNISVAQKVQTGLGKADIVYETEVEGGITRLLAVFQDITEVDKLGTIRSARYDYIDLAMGHNAVYVHHGSDKTYAAGHLTDADSFEIHENNGGFRISNGLSLEHTLYTTGENLWASISKKFSDVSNSKSEPWQSFSAEELQLSEAANTVTVKFSGAQKTVFKYDTESGKYVRYTGTTERKDYETGESMYFKNVFVLNTSIGDLPDKYHKNIELEGGDGYYFVNGTYTPIKWTKGASENPIKLTNLDGSELKVNVGNSWVCISDKNRAKPVIE